MPRLFVHVEGQTEETFVNEQLRDHLVRCGYDSVSARLIGNARQRARRGGIRPWGSTRNDIVRHLINDQGSIATTMVDYYGMPSIGAKAWPGRQHAKSQAQVSKATTVEQALKADLLGATNPNFNADRFVPFVVMHEFEGLLFSDCGAFARGIGRSDLESQFQAIRNQFATPEEINDAPHTAPSARVGSLVPGYDKPLAGVLAALEIGLDGIRAACPHFDDWLKRLEGLVQ